MGSSTMYVCICHAVSDKKITQAVEQGCCSYRDIRDTLNVGKTCGRCVPEARALINETLVKLAVDIPNVA